MKPSELERRRLLQLLGTSAVGWAWSGSSWSQTRFSDDPFTLGVASGSPTFDSVVLWTRLGSVNLAGARPGNDPIPVRWELAQDENFAHVVQSGQVPALSELAYSVHAEVVGLAPDRWYFYRFMVGNALSPVGRTRTLPRADAQVASLRLAYASCQKWEDGYFSAWRHMREENLDLVLFLGDYIYEYPGTGSKLRRPSGSWVLSLDDYRRRYALYKGDADLQAMHAACPWLVTWDDHEVQNDYAGAQAGQSGPSDPSVPTSFLTRRAAAYQAWYEHMPVRASVLTQGLAGLVTGAEMRIYQRLDYGRLASIYLLDTRQYRDPQVCNKDNKFGSNRVNPATCQAWHDTRRSLLGSAQEAWLDQQFGAARSREIRWNVLGQQTLVGQRDFGNGTNQVFWNDGWDGYTAARTRLTEALQRHNPSNPVCFGGDVHENWVGHLKADYSKPTSTRLGVEFCGTSITSRSGGNAKTPDRLAANPHFVFADGERKGYGVAMFTPSQLSAKLRVVDDISRPDTQLETLASFKVQAGRPLVERV